MVVAQLLGELVVSYIQNTKYLGITQIRIVGKMSSASKNLQNLQKPVYVP